MSAAAWMKPAIVAPPPALKGPVTMVVANAAACSLMATAAPQPTAREIPPWLQTRTAEESFGAAAAK